MPSNRAFYYRKFHDEFHRYLVPVPVLRPFTILQLPRRWSRAGHALLSRARTNKNSNRKIQQVQEQKRRTHHWSQSIVRPIHLPVARPARSARTHGTAPAALSPTQQQTGLLCCWRVRQLQVSYGHHKERWNGFQIQLCPI